MELASSEVNTPLERVGLWCLRTSLVALAMGVAETLLLSKRVPAPLPGLACAIAGLWVPASAVAVAVATWLRQRLPRVSVNSSLVACTALVGLALVVALLAPTDSRAGWTYVIPLELVLSLSVSWALTAVPAVPALAGWRRPLAIFGLALVLWLQLFASRWVDGHRPFAGAMTDAVAWPRLMLRGVLSRIA